MLFAIPLRPSQVSDLAQVCDLGVEALEGVLAALQRAPVTIRRERLRHALSELLPDEAKEPFIRVIFGLSELSSRDVKGYDDVIKALNKSIAADPQIKSRLANWPAISKTLLNILRCKSVYLVAKSEQIAYDFERILTEARIITSIRPVFDDQRNEVVGNTIVQTLRLDYLLAGSEKGSFSIALDRSDIESLAKVCNDALHKADVVSGELSGASNKEIVMMGLGDAG